MARTKTGKLTPWQKLLTIMLDGNPVTLDEMQSKLGNEIYMYRISTYMWDIKSIAGGVVKAIKDGRKVVAYQIMNVKDVKAYMDRSGVSKIDFVPGQDSKKPSIAKLSDLKAKPVKTKVAKPVKTKTAKPVAKPEPVSEVMEVSEVLETE